MDYALLNGKFATMIEEGQFAQAVGIEGNKICFVGTNEEIEKNIDKDTIILDMDNKLVVPGFNDSHIHLLNYGYAKTMVDLVNCKSIEDMKKETLKYKTDRNVARDKWILGRGWNQDYLQEKRFPTKEDLDEISSENPICFIRACGHVVIGNSMAVDIVKKKYKSPINVDLDRGYFYEDGCEYIYNVIDAPDVKEIKEYILSAAKDFSLGGITSVQSDDLATMPNGDFKLVLQAYEELNAEGLLPIRVYEQSLLGDMDTLNEFLELGYKTGHGDEFFKIGPLKLLLDGSLGARTALVYNGYEDDKSQYGVAVYTNEELLNIVKRGIDNKMQVAIHAIGDKAIDICLDTIIATQDIDNDSRHGIVHCQITTDEIIQKMKKNNIIAYIQPIFIDYDMHIVEERIGRDRSVKTYSWKTMIDNGIIACGGSDCPVVNFNILENIYTAVTRKDLNGYPNGGWLQDQKLSVYQALELFTTKGAYSSFEEGIKGTIEVDKLADLAVLSKDIFTINEENIKEVKVEKTILDGQILHQ